MRILLVVFCCAIFLLSLVRTQSCQTSTTGEVEIICSSVEKVDWSYIGSQLTCRGDKSITWTLPDSSVTSVVYSNRSEVTNLTKITALKIDGAVVNFLSSGIKSHFTSLKGLQIRQSGLLSVSKEDLRQFGNSLEMLSLSINKLISINLDLLDYNPNLRAIYLNDNPLRYIQENFFTNLKNLKNLKFVNLERVNCMSQYFDTSKLGHILAIFIWNNGRCVSETARIETSLAPINARVQQSLNNEFCLKKENAELKEQMMKLSKNFEKFKCQMSSIEAKLDETRNII